MAIDEDKKTRRLHVWAEEQEDTGAPRGILTGVSFGQRLMVSLPGHHRRSGLRGVWGWSEGGGALGPERNMHSWLSQQLPSTWDNP